MTKTFKGNGQVWDPSVAKVIARFERPKGSDIEARGTFTTADERLIARLEAMGYRAEPAADEPAPVVVAKPVAADPAPAGDTAPAAEPAADEPAGRGGRRKKVEA